MWQYMYGNEQLGLTCTSRLMRNLGATLQGPKPSMKPWASTNTSFSTASGYSNAKSTAMAPPRLVPTTTMGLLIYAAHARQLVFEALSRQWLLYCCKVQQQPRCVQSAMTSVTTFMANLHAAECEIYTLHLGCACLGKVQPCMTTDQILLQNQG